MSDEPAVLVEQAGAVRRLVLNRPAQRNAIDPRLLAELDAALAAAAQDDGVSVVVLAGRGPSFCAGADLRHLRSLCERAGDPLAWIAEISAAITRLERCPKPVVAALHGHVVAGGLELALACDAVLAADGTLIGDGHVRNRLLPGGGSSVRLARAVGVPLARWLLLSGELLPAERFAAAGWLHAVVPGERLEAEAHALAERLAAASGPAQRNLKALLSEQRELTLDAGLAAELRAFERNWADADVPAGLEAFLARRSTTHDRT